MITATVEDKKGRGRPRTKALHRVESGLYESKDGRFLFHGSGKRGRKQEWTVEDTNDNSTLMTERSLNLNQILTVLSNQYPESF